MRCSSTRTVRATPSAPSSGLRVALIGALLALSACEDQGVVVARRTRGSSAPEPGAPSLGDVEGAAGREALLTRAQAAIQRGDDRALLLCVRPEVRAAWLRDLALELAIESTERPLDADATLHARRATVRAILKARDATVRSAPAALDTTSLGDALLERVSDRLALHAELLGFARDAGAPYDPVRPLLRPSAEQGSSPLFRLVERVRSPATLTPGPEGSSKAERGVGFVESQRGPVPIRFYENDGVTWFDES